MQNKPGEILYDKDIIQERVKELGREMAKDYAGKDPILVCVLNGALFFYADLAKQMDIKLRMDTIDVSSYGSGIKSSGKLTINKNIGFNITNQHIIIVEDIVDSGFTLNRLLAHLGQYKPKSIKTCTFLQKKNSANLIRVKYVGFLVATEEFLVGYGLDYIYHYRNLSDIIILDKKFLR